MRVLPSASVSRIFAAAVAWGAQWDYHRVWLGRRQLAVNSPVSVNQEHLMWVLGVDSFDAALAKLEQFKLDGVAQRITCPFLVVHGARDQQIPLSDARALYEAAASADKALVVLDEEDLGDQHCQIDNVHMAHYHILGWLRDKLMG